MRGNAFIGLEKIYLLKKLREQHNRISTLEGEKEVLLKQIRLLMRQLDLAEKAIEEGRMRIRDRAKMKMNYLKWRDK